MSASISRGIARRAREGGERELDGLSSRGARTIKSLPDIYQISRRVLFRRICGSWRARSVKKQARAVCVACFPFRAGPCIPEEVFVFCWGHVWSEALFDLRDAVPGGRGARLEEVGEFDEHSVVAREQLPRLEQRPAHAVLVL